MTSYAASTRAQYASKVRFHAGRARRRGDVTMLKVYGFCERPQDA